MQIAPSSCPEFDPEGVAGERERGPGSSTQPKKEEE